MSRSDNNDTRRHVQVLPERVGSVSGTDFPHHYPGEDHSWNLEKFTENLIVSVQKLTPSTIEFDLVGVDASIANALRRMMIAEIPTIAIEDVYVWNNTSIMQDEVLAHRIGLIPLRVDPRLLRYRTGEKPHDTDTLIFDLRVRCDRIPGTKGETDPRKMYYDSNVYSGMLQWQVSGNQKTVFKQDGDPAPVADDILLVKLRPGQMIDFHCFAQKGIGADHAKYSPVATASYRLLPHIILRKPIPQEHQAKFQKCFPPGVIEIQDDENGDSQVVVANPRKDTVSREVLRHPEFEGLVELARIRDHFLFSVESAGQYPPQDLIPEAIKLLLEKIENVEKGLEELFAPGTV